MTGRLLVASSIALLGVSSCASPELTRRYASATWVQAPASGPLVEVNAFSISPPGAAKTATLLSLSERGQSMLIKSLAEKSKNASALMETLGGSIGKTGKPGLIIDRTEIKRRIVLSSSRLGAARQLPGDRIQSLSCTFDNLSNEATFKSWDKFSTTHETVDLGKITLAQTSGANLAVNATSAEDSGDPVARGFDVSRSRTLTEEVSLRQRYVVLSGILAPHTASVMQEGVVGIDLSGNAFIDITFDLADKSEEPVLAIGPYKKDGKWLEPGKIPTNRRFVRYPSGGEVTGDLSCDYVVRAISDDKSRRSVVEGDDKARYIFGRTGKQTGLTLVPHSDVDFHVWFVVDAQGNALSIEFGQSATAVQFATYESAAAFLDWLVVEGAKQSPSVQIGGKRLLLSKAALTADQVARLSINVERP